MTTLCKALQDCTWLPDGSEAENISICKMQKLRYAEFMKPTQGPLTDNGLVLPDNLTPLHLTIPLYSFFLQHNFPTLF